MTTLTLITRDAALINDWQMLSPHVVTGIPDNHNDTLWLLDCTSLSDDLIQAVIDRQPSCCYALVDNQALLTVGGALFDADIPILKKPLTARSKIIIEQALQPSATFDATQTRPSTYSGLAQEFALHASDISRFTRKIAATVKEIMHADWVAFISVAFHQNENYSADVLAMVGDVPEDHASNVIRPHGYTLHILKTHLPVVMPDVRTFHLDDIEVNPRTIEAGFRAGLGLPLLLHDGEPFGVMWVMYNEPHQFSYADVRHMQVYASHVALAYSYHVQKKLVEQWQRAAQRIFTRSAEQLTLSDTLQHITAGIHDTLDCDAVILYHDHDMSGQVNHVYFDGDVTEDTGALIQTPLLQQIAHDTQPLILEDAQSNERLHGIAIVQEQAIQSVILMPLQHAAQHLGLIWLHYLETRHFTDEERQAITLFADQIAVSISNAMLDAQRNSIHRKNTELLEQLREQGEQLQTLVKVIDIERNLNNQDRQAILRTIASQSCVAADADRVTIRLVQDDHVAALAVYPESDTDIDVQHSENWEIRAGGHSQHIVETNQPVIIPDVDNYNPDEYGGIEINPRWRGVWKARIGLPLTSGEKTIGVMWLSFRQPRPVTTSQLSAFQSFANIAFLTKMYDIEQERLQHALRVMQRAHQQINISTGRDAILQQTMQLAQEIVSTRDTSCRSFIAIVHHQQVMLRRDQNDPDTYETIRQVHKFDETVDQIMLDDRFQVTQTVFHGETERIDEFDVMADAMPVLLDTYAGSQLYVPVRVGEKVTAVVGVESTLPYAFEWYDEATLEWLASYAGQVIHNHQQQQMRQALFEASQAITAGKDLPAVLQTIARQAHRVLEIKRGSDDHDAYVGLRHDESLVFMASYPPQTLANIQQVGLQQIDLTQERIGVSAGAMQHNQPLLINDTTLDNRAFHVDHDAAPLSLLAVPIPDLHVDEPALGVITLGHRAKGSFDDDDLTFITLFTKFAAVAIRRAREIDEQEAQRQSFFELTRAAMDQVIASHDLNNFRMIYKFELPRLREYVATVLEQEERILKSINDSQVFDALEAAMEALPESLKNLEETYHSRIDHDAYIPELGDLAPFAMRAWLWEYHKARNVNLQIDDTLTDSHQSLIPKYWLQEVIKILLTNARRALRQSGLLDTNGRSDARLISMTVIYQPGVHQVQIRIANQGDKIPATLQPLLARQVIPKNLRSDDNGRGIGLFMSGIIMRAYDGDIYYDDTADQTAFVMDVPLV